MARRGYSSVLGRRVNIIFTTVLRRYNIFTQARGKGRRFLGFTSSMGWDFWGFRGSY